MKNGKIVKSILLIGVFLFLYLAPIDAKFFPEAILSGLLLVQDYVREHILTCLLPAFFIAGAITVFIKKDLVLRYLGGEVKKWLSYLFASVSGLLLAVCSCTILPLFAGIRKRGAGLGPATTFLFAGPAINIAAIFLTISVLGYEIGIARVIFSILFSILIGISMQFIFKEKSSNGEISLNEEKDPGVNTKTLVIFFSAMIGFLLIGGFQIPETIKYSGMILFVLITIFIGFFSFRREVSKEWMKETGDLMLTLIPLLFIGVFIAGFLMPFISDDLIISLVGSNSFSGNLIASVFGALIYFSTLTEVPILQVLMAKGMSSGPALALLLAGPSLSLPNMLVIRRVLGNKKTIIYILLVIVYSAIAGSIFGFIV